MPWQSDSCRCLDLLRANGIVPLRPPPPSQSLKGKRRASDSQAGGSGATQHDQKRVRVEAIKAEDALKVECADDNKDFSAAEDVNCLEVCFLRELHSPQPEQSTGATGTSAKAHCGREGCAESRNDR